MLIETNDYVDVATAGNILGIKRSRMSILCNSGRFKNSVKIGHFWIILKSELENYKRQKPGRKRVIEADQEGGRE